MSRPPPDCSANPFAIGRPSPVPEPTGFVVKNGSTAWVSHRRIHTDPAIFDSKLDIAPDAQAHGWVSPAATVSSRADSITVPPSGMASRALVARLISAVSSSLLSVTRGGSTGCKSRRTDTFPPSVWVGTSQSASRTKAGSIRTRWNGLRRAKPSRRLVMSEPRSQALRASCVNLVI